MISPLGETVTRIISTFFVESANPIIEAYNCLILRRDSLASCSYSVPPHEKS